MFGNVFSKLLPIKKTMQFITTTKVQKTNQPIDRLSFVISAQVDLPRH